MDIKMNLDKVKKKVEEKAPKIIIDLYQNMKFKYGFSKGYKTWSQEGEDMILRRIMTSKKGFYIDIGAHHPYRYSNTYYFYKKGWTGINIDASPLSIDLFKKYRPNDININSAVSKYPKEHIFYIFNDGAYNTLSSALAEQTIKKGLATLIERKKIKSNSLENILNKNIKESRHIDLMTIDVEGYDLEVIQSNNWEKYRPDVLLIEYQWSTIEEIIKSEIYKYISSKGYLLYSKCVNTLIFISQDAYNKHKQNH